MPATFEKGSVWISYVCPRSRISSALARSNKGHQPRQVQHLLRLNGYAAEVLIAPGFYFTNGENS